MSHSCLQLTSTTENNFFQNLSYSGFIMLHLNIKCKLSSGSTLPNGQMMSPVPCNQGTPPLKPTLTRRRIWVRMFGTKSGLFQVSDQKFEGE